MHGTTGFVLGVTFAVTCATAFVAGFGLSEKLNSELNEKRLKNLDFATTEGAV